ncbi:SLC13 family permease [Guyparkeria hydrothermalis]|uniref:SLC13 family permease n=1 Tax=Guyparkeria hydrothermalis TaxID=923 RepID=UPI002020E8DA|nr:SLC13 family permease [Guyparkeria hydrothermalis]MCL7750876.1 SLC13 family permease [Guyparkeria hydrothermalis]
MTTDQGLLFAILGLTLAGFAWGRLRYDVVALLALLATGLTGLVPPAAMFSGLSHPAVITVAAVLILSRALINAGVIDVLARRLTRVGDRPMAQVITLTGVVALSSAFINNVGALALFMPVAVWMARHAGRSPSFLLMPLAFGSLLGGTLTLIGTPPNIIIATYRVDTGAPAFGMFDFLPVGLAITLAGIAFIALVGWRLTPCRSQSADNGELFEIENYLTEVRVPESSSYAGRSVHELIDSVAEETDVMVTALLREGERRRMPSTYEVLRPGDILLIEADSDGLQALIDVTGVELAAGETAESEEETDKTAGELTLAEAIVAPNSRLVGNSAGALDLRERYGVNVLAVARQGRRLKQRISHIRFLPGDILLLQGREESLPGAMSRLGCLPLAARGLNIARPRRVALGASIFVAGLALVAFDLLPVAMALVGTAVAMVIAGLLPSDDAYRAIDMPVIVLLAAMLPVGQALETTGGSALIAETLLVAADHLPAFATLALLMTAVMLLSNLVNNAAAAVLAAPIGIQIAQGMNASPDPFLMAVAIGASCAFLTPIGHQSNTLVMAPGGYQFGDYWRMGLPLSLLVIVVAVPMILWVWPMAG